MTTNKIALLALIVLVLGGGLIVSGCDPEPGDEGIGYSVSAEGASGKDTEKLIFTFDSDIGGLGLTASDIKITPSDVKPGSSLTGSGTSYSIPIEITGFSRTISASVSITRSGISPGSKSVSVERYGTIDYDLSSDKVNGGISKLSLTFGRAISNLTLGEVNITGAIPGAPTGSDRNWDIPLTNAYPGEIIVKIIKIGVNELEKKHTLSDKDDGEPSTPTGKVTKIDIEHYPDYGWPAPDTVWKKFEVEIGSPTTFTAEVTPFSATNKTVTWAISPPQSLVTVDKNGRVTAHSMPPPPLEIFISATSNDNPNVVASEKIKVIEMATPTNLSIPTSGSRVDTDSSNYKIDDLKLGETVIFSTQLSVGGTTRTRDQAVITNYKAPSPVANKDIVTIRKLNELDTNGYPQWSITPTNNSSEGQEVTYTFTANGNHTAVNKTLHVTNVIYEPVTITGTKFHNMKADGTPDTPAYGATVVCSVVFPTSPSDVKTRKIVIVPDEPFTSVSLTSSYTKAISVSTISATKGEFTLTLVERNWGVVPVTLKATVTDVKNNKIDVTLVISTG
jgi:hypothetical protein